MFAFTSTSFLGLCVLTWLLAAVCQGNTDLSGIQVRYGTVTYDPDGADQYVGKVTIINSGSADIDTGSQPVTINVCFIRYGYFY